MVIFLFTGRMKITYHNIKLKVDSCPLDRLEAGS